jgi:hypothetical protein
MLRAEMQTAPNCVKREVNRMVRAEAGSEPFVLFGERALHLFVDMMFVFLSALVVLAGPAVIGMLVLLWRERREERLERIRALGPFGLPEEPSSPGEAPAQERRPGRAA